MSTKPGINIFPLLALILGLGGGIAIGFVLFNNKGGEEYDPYLEEQRMLEEMMEEPMVTERVEEVPIEEIEGGEIVPLSVPNSNIVAAGMKFETQLMLVQTTPVHPEFSGTGSIMVNPGGGTATMSIQAPGGFAKGQYEKEQSYSAKIRSVDGKEYSINETFTVVKPVVEVSSASVQHLYYKCGNTLNIAVPALGDLYNPVFKASSAEVLPSKTDRSKVTIIPSGKKCVVSVSSNTNGQMIKIDDLNYTVINPPKPEIQLLVNGKEYNGAAPISSKSNVILKVKPDADFMAALPKDARYTVSRVDLLVQKTLGAPAKVGTFSGEGADVKIPLGTKLKGYDAGTKIYFKVDRIYRVNFKAQKVEVKFADADLYRGAIIK